MRIALLAGTGAGKTTYLTGLYRHLIRNLNGTDYGIDFTFDNPAQKGVLTKRYTALSESGDFGPGSKQYVDYPITLSTQTQDGRTKRLSITLADFPGGHLAGASEEEGDAEKIEETIERLSQCDGFIVLLDGHALVEAAKNEDSEDLKDALNANDVRTVLDRALERRRNALKRKKEDPNAYPFSYGPAPVVFTITKWDEVNKWLQQDQKNNVTQLKRTISGAYSRAARASYETGEGVISNLVRSQFPTILKADDVMSARTGVCVFNEEKRRFDARNIEHALQLVLFRALINAEEEYQRRDRDWSEDHSQKASVYFTKASEHQAATTKADERAAMGFWKRTWLAIDTGEGVATLRARQETAAANAQAAARAKDSSLLSVRQVADNRETVQLLLPRILSDDLAYRLVRGTEQQRYYVQGLPSLKELSRHPEFSEKVKFGKKLFDIEHGL